MKRKPAWMGTDRKGTIWRRLFAKTCRSRVRHKLNRKAKALTAANRRAWVAVVAGLCISLALFAVFLWVPPQILPEQLAASVREQKSRGAGRDPIARIRYAEPAERGSSPGNSAAFGAKPAWDRTGLEPQAQVGYTAISFEQLSAFQFSVTDQMLDNKKDALAGSRQILGQIPDEVRALDHKEISLRGFMLPMKLDGKRTTEFLLLKNRGLCCYGAPPKITEWVNVHVNGKGVRPVMDEPITVCGTFHIGDVRENGELLGIYRLEAHRLKGPGQ
jgi:hypothetical protein